ncbi:MAG: hypothetical protein K940chlam3_01492 [Chlamydiae bacterium]|nr:hypothetical protein [Chlamydiota bacterium]
MISTLQEELEISCGQKLKLRINDNHSTMLSVRWEPDHTRVSLHRIFLEAPRNVMEALACYIKGGRNISLPVPIKAYIEYQMQRLDYSHVVKKHELVTAGQHYHLQPIYDRLNQEYFLNELNIQITWYGRFQRRFRSQVNFGLYSDALKLVKIHRLLDHSDIPEYFLEFVIYHEMLHSVCLPFVKENGHTSVHTPEFKQREKEHKYFDEAHIWLKNNKHRFFR